MAEIRKGGGKTQVLEKQNKKRERQGSAVVRWRGGESQDLKVASQTSFLFCS